ncbi:hypothetical protein evm_006708 [Chilo suppressalis]|uniref:Sulfakinin n=1 Tax=Chilo suppressalis TaxID=168631 RepID=A0A0S1U0U3_CHISP|nr:sulfakinin precursor [Chilo suppressalis]RVE48637.1 hypothetical protein evm_006708 [Chilo suppressalis]
MRVVTIFALAVVVTLSLFLRYSEGAGLHRFSLPEDDEEPRLRPLYRDYSLIRRAARADDAFDDYGHLRFGRSED